MKRQFIGEGSYGCVHRPSLECQGKNITYKKKISKTMLTKHAVKELHEYDKIAHIDKDRKFFMGKPIKCQPKNTPENLKPLQKCRILQRHLSNKDIRKSLPKLSMLVMNDGGYELKTFSKKMESLVVNEENKLQIYSFLLEMYRIFKGIELFQKNEFVHHDIKPQNVLYDPKTRRANFIDFGLSRTFDKIIKDSVEDINPLADYAFWSFPFEIQFLNKDDYMKIAYMSKEQRREYMDDIINDYKTGADTKFNIAMELFFDYILYNKSSEEKSNIISKYIEDFSDMIFEFDVKKYDTFVNLCINTIDLYGLAMTLQYVILHIHKYLDNQMCKDLEELFYQMMRPNIFRRMTTSIASDKYKEILEKYGIKEKNKTLSYALSKKLKGITVRNDTHATMLGKSTNLKKTASCRGRNCILSNRQTQKIIRSWNRKLRPIQN